MSALNGKPEFRHIIDATDREIDRLVYDLYGLTEEEIGIVEACGESFDVARDRLSRTTCGEPFDKTQDRPGRTGATVASAPAPCKNVLAWSLDTDYNDLCFHVSHCRESPR